MPILQNARHERFAQLVASGKHSDMEAFKQARYADESGHLNACRLRANESVAARIEELRARNAEKCQLSREITRRLAAKEAATPPTKDTGHCSTLSAGLCRATGPEHGRGSLS
jgi:hypothetical protein